MNTNNYKAAMQNEKFDERRLDELCELLANYDEPKSKTKSSAKKLRLPFLLAAALIISAIGCITLAAAGTGLSDISRRIIGVVANTPHISEVSNDISQLAPKITAVYCDGQRAWIEITVDTNNIEMPDDISQMAKFGFKSDINDLSPEKNTLPRLPKENSGIYKFVYDLNGMEMALRRFPDAEIKLANFGYYFRGEFTSLAKGLCCLKLSRTVFDSAKYLKKTASAIDVKGVMLDVELSPLGLIVRGSYTKMVELNLHKDELFLENPIDLEFYMNDGTVMKFYDGQSIGTLYELVLSTNKRVDFENDMAVFEYPFKSPLDIDTVEAISVHGVKFDVDYHNSESQDGDNSHITDISSYFDSVIEEYWKDSIKVFAERDTDKYADTKTIFADTNSAESKISPKITAIVCDRHCAWIQITVDTNNLDIPKDIPANAMFGFKHNGILSGVYDHYKPSPIPKQNSGVYVFTYEFRDIGYGSHWFSGKTELILEDFGYYIYNEFIPVEKGRFSFKLTEDMLDTVKNSKKVSKNNDTGEANVKLELTPISLVMLSSDRMNFKVTDIEIYMSDGSILRYIDGPSKSGFIGGGLYGLIAGMDGGIEPESGISIEQYSFSAPFDIDEIEAITVDGVRFEFEYPTDENEDISQSASDNAE